MVWRLFWRSGILEVILIRYGIVLAEMGRQCQWGDEQSQAVSRLVINVLYLLGFGRRSGRAGFNVHESHT
jgi:hypothetical protein